MRIVTDTLIDQATPGSEHGADSVQTAASHLYDAECAFHTASQTHVDAWILAASGRLDSAIASYLAAVSASGIQTV